MRFAIAAVSLACVVTSGHAAAMLSEDQATGKVITYLRGDIYGPSNMDVITAIKRKQLMMKGSGACGPIAAPVWAFHIRAKYDGWLYLDAASGEKVCSSLPFFR